MFNTVIKKPGGNLSSEYKKIFIYSLNLIFILILLAFGFYFFSLKKKYILLTSDLVKKEERILNQSEQINNLWNKIKDQEQKEISSQGPGNESYCGHPADTAMFSQDKKYYIANFFFFGLSVCNSNKKHIPGELTGKIQFKNKIIMSYIDNLGNNSGLLFKVDTDKKTLEYFTEKYLNEEENYFIAPSETESNAWSEDGRFILISASSCYGCSTTPSYYAFDTEQNKFIHLGLIYNKDYSWLSKNSIKWMSYTTRARRPGEGDGLDFPVVFEKTGYVTTVLE